jgi:hypothetical protein
MKEGIKNVLDRRNANRNKPLVPHEPSKGSKNKYFSFKVENNNPNDENDIREILRACL